MGFTLPREGRPSWRTDSPHAKRRPVGSRPHRIAEAGEGWL